MRSPAAGTGRGQDHRGGERNPAAGLGAASRPGTARCPASALADKMLDGVTCIRLDASVVTCHGTRNEPRPNFKGYDHHPLLGLLR